MIKPVPSPVNSGAKTKPVDNVAKLLKTRLNRFSRGLEDLERGDVAALHRVRVASRTET